MAQVVERLADGVLVTDDNPRTEAAGQIFDDIRAGFVVRSVQIDYHAAARLDDAITLTLDIGKLGRASVVFSQQALRGEQLLASAQVKVGCVDLATLRPRAIPDDAAAKMRAT